MTMKGYLTDWQNIYPTLCIGDEDDGGDDDEKWYVTWQINIKFLPYIVNKI